MADYKAIVTGGAKGIGYAIASAILEAGGKVVEAVLLYSVCSLITNVHGVHHLNLILKVKLRLSLLIIVEGNKSLLCE